MYSSPNIKKDIVFDIYNDKNTVYLLNDIAMLVEEPNFNSLNKRINYIVKKGKLQNLRKGIYSKPVYSREELACRIFIPSYISLEYVLQKAGVIFQYSTQITSVSYLSRSVEIDEGNYVFRKIKGSILVDTIGINRNDHNVNIATTERAFLDMLYLDGNYYFDNLNPLNKDLIFKILPIYQSKILTKRVTEILKNDRSE